MATKRRGSRGRARSLAKSGWQAHRRSDILRALRRVHGSLAKRLQRQALLPNEAIYLRGLANLKRGKRLTLRQREVLASAARVESTDHRLVGPSRREERLVDEQRAREDARAERVKPFGLKSKAWATALHLHPRKAIFLVPRQKGGVVQRWSRDGFQRFMALPHYKVRREKVLSEGTFWFATPDKHGDLPRRGKTRVHVE